MPCLNCNSRKLHIDKTVNLAVCNVCGMIQANRIYVVQSKTGRIPTLWREHGVLNLLCSEFECNKYIKDIIENYNTIQVSGKFSTYSLAERYCAITTFTLKDLKQINNMRAYCRFTGADYNKSMRLLKKINNHFSRTGIFTVDDLTPYFRKVGIKEEDANLIIEMSKNTPYTLTRGLAAALFYEYTKQKCMHWTNLTQRKTCELFGVSMPCLKRNLKKLR